MPVTTMPLPRNWSSGLLPIYDVAVVLSGFLHILKPDGFAEIHVPDIKSVMKRFIDTGMDIQDMLCESASGPISVHGVISVFTTGYEPPIRVRNHRCRGMSFARRFNA